MDEKKCASCPRYIEETPVRRRLAPTAGGDPLFVHCRSRRFPILRRETPKRRSRHSFPFAREAKSDCGHTWRSAPPKAMKVG